MGWSEYALAFAAFFLTHSVPLRPPVKRRLVGVLGARGFTLAYSALSLFVLGWLIEASSRAPYVGLWDWAPWQNHVPLTVMGVVCLLLALSLGRPNPFSFGGAGNDRFDPAHPGLVRWTRHPLLLALALWAGAHLVPNGDLAHVLLFGTFAGFALLGMWIVDRRRRREMGPRWDELLAKVRAGPVVPVPQSAAGLALRCGLALGVYLLLLAAHPYLFGVSPLPV
ncbi:NnrU family protein [Stappia indica]|uniref:NnrU family protein n=1 Tax=Stappia indica TaxID=538381 RepID=UPI001CD28BBB|nr:NnrU family protein [Stappia indica]MCA1298614.1 NnrU family protein [Stappia indica]